MVEHGSGGGKFLGGRVINIHLIVWTGSRITARDEDSSIGHQGHGMVRARDHHWKCRGGKALRSRIVNFCRSRGYLPDVTPGDEHCAGGKKEGSVARPSG